MTELSLFGVGRAVTRTYTDKLFYFIFFAANMLLIGLLFVANFKGDMRKITHGTDYNGNLCGVGYPSNLTISESDWASRKYLWYPFSYDEVTREFRILSAIKYGICVSDCNPSEGRVETYGGDYNVNTQSFKVLLQSEETFHRCVPNFKSFVCPSGNCTADAEKSNGKAAAAMGFTGFFFGLVQQVYSSLWVTFLFFFAAVALCFIWIIFLRRAVKPVVIVAMCLVFVVGSGITISIFAHYKSLQNDPTTEGSDSAKLTLLAGVVAAVLVFLYVCVMLFMRKSIMLSCDIIEEGTRIIADIPAVMLVPVGTSVVMFGNVVMFAAIAALLYTIGVNETRSTEVQNSFGQMVTVKTHVYSRPKWVDVGQVFNLFMMLWVLAFQNGVAYMTVALSGVTWFFSAPGDDKDKTSRVLESYCTVIKYHPGTVAFGSLLFAIMGFLRMIMRALEKRFRATKGANTACCLVLCCANCCLSCLESIVKFITEHGFVMTAMTGGSLIEGARESVRLLSTNPSVLTINVISDVVLAVSRVLIVIVVTFAGIIALDAREGNNSTTVAACGLVLAIGTWYIAGAFTRVMTVCIDTTLLCFCYDLDQNNGADRPYYAPEGLKQHIKQANDRQKEKDKNKGVEQGLLNNRH